MQDAPPAKLTRHALLELAKTLPQPISTTRFSNRSKIDSIFSDRESIGCPSLSSSPASDNSSTNTSVSLSTLPDDFLPSRDFKKGDVILPLFTRTTTHRLEQERKLSEQIARAKQERERQKKAEQELERQRDLAIKQRDAEIQAVEDRDREKEQDRMLALMAKERVMEAKRAAAGPKVVVDKKRQLVPMNFIPAKPKTSMMISKAGPLMASPKSTTLVYSSEPDAMDTDLDSAYFSASPSSSASSLLTPTCAHDVTDEFVQTVFTYLSMPHGVIAKRFDAEIAMAVGCSVAEVAGDRMSALRVYVEKYIDSHPTIRKGEGCW